MTKRKIYRGRGCDEIFAYVSQHGELVGSIIRANGDHVADVSLSVVGDEVYLEVDGIEYSSITDALRQRYDELAIHDAGGSDGSGDIANNIIGNYAILRHVSFGNKTLEDIVGAVSTSTSSASRKVRAPKKKSVTVFKSPDDVPARGNLYDFFSRDTIVAIANAMGGAERFQASLEGKTVAQFAQEHGLTA